MNIFLSRKHFSDKLSVCLSLCCILHCIALPTLVILMPSLASFWINSESVHIVLVLLAIPISLFAMTKSLRKHNDYKCIGLAIMGLFLLTIAIFVHDIGFISEPGHGESGHGESGHGEHDNHSGLEEMLETIFTVMGGLVLLSAHFLNIRLTNRIA